MKLNWPLLIVSGLVVVMTGCGSLRNGGAPEPSFDTNADLEKLSKEFESATNITNYYGTPDPQKMAARNRFISGRLVQIDLRYLQFIRGLTSDKQQLDSATDIATLTLNLAGTLVGAARAKTNLAAMAAGIGGAKTTIDKDFYYEKSVEALVATMNAKRKEVLVSVLEGLSRPVNQYPFERALTDINQYYLAGTINGALHFINAQAAQKEKDSDTEIKEIYRIPIPTLQQVDNTEKLTDAIGAADITLAKANQVLQALGVQAAALPSSLDGAGGARQKLKDLVRAAMRTQDDNRRTAEIQRLTVAFRNAGLTS